MDFKPIKKVKGKPDDFVCNFEQNIYDTEYIALPKENNYDNRVNFQNAMRFTIKIGQKFGLIPVLGVSANDVSKIRFVFYSGMCLYSVMSAIGQSILVSFYILKIFWETEASLQSNSGMVFYGCNFVMTIQFLRIATKWPKLSRQIAKLEEIDPTLDKTLVWKCNSTCILVLLLGAVEHILSDLAQISAAKACQPEKNFYNAYLEANFYWVWIIVPYNTFLGLMAKFISIQCTFNWNYSDAFIMCICWYLIARLQQVNGRLRKVAGRTAPQHFWRTMRQDYTKATNLVRNVDEIINGVIFVSFASNIFSICFFVLHMLQEGLKPYLICGVPAEKRLVGGYEHAILIYSLSFLILRSLVLSIMAAHVNYTSTEAAFTLYEVPFESYNVEVQRFLDQVHGDSTVLSGLQFFSVKRGMILTIAATIVTYELVLIQFSSVQP